MSFGSETEGGSPEGIGGNESGIGDGGSGGGGGSGGNWGGFADAFGPTSIGSMFEGFGDIASAFDMSGIENIGYSSYGGTPSMTTDISQALSAMSVVEQENMFRTVVEPALDLHYGWQGDVASAIAKGFISTAINAFAPGLGTLANIIGLTGYVSDRLTKDMPFAQTLGERLGVRSSTDFSGTDVSGGKDVIQRAIEMGKTPQEILSSVNETVRAQGGDMSTWDEIWGGITGSTAAGAATGAAQTQAGYQQQALDYLKSREAMPLQISGGAMEKLGGLYGLEGGAGSQQELIDYAKASPMYGAIMGGREAGEESIMRQAGRTGGLRSGNVQENLYDYNTQLQNQALQSAYGQQLGGLQYLAGQQPGGAAGIAGAIGGIGSTLAGGQLVAAKAGEKGMANLLGMGGSAYQAAGGLSGIMGGLGSAGTAYTTAGGGLSGVGAAGSDLFNTVAGWF